MKCRCGLPIVKRGRTYPDCYDKDLHVSWISYLCSDGHENCVSRLTPSVCQCCGADNWDFQIIGNDNSQWTCLSCFFQVVQTGYLTLYHLESWSSDVACPLCSSVQIYQRDKWFYSVYDDEHTSLSVKMVSYSCECADCSAHWYLRSCIYCNSARVSCNPARVDVHSGISFSVWKHECKCLDCHRSFYYGSGWSD